MQSINSYAWIMMITSLLGMLFYLAMLVYVCMAKSDGSGAKRLAVIGIAMIVFCGSTQWLVPIVASRFTGSESIIMVQMISQVVFGLIRCVAMGLIIAAVFTGRNPGQSFHEPDSAVHLPPKNDSNPYSSPSV